jgi:hypothetical protein
LKKVWNTERGAKGVGGVGIVIRNEFLEPEAFPPAVHDYLVQTDRLPAWADPGLIAVGQ